MEEKESKGIDGYEFKAVDFDNMSDEDLKKRTRKALEDWVSGKYGPCDDGEEDSEETVEENEAQTKSVFELYKDKMSK